MRDERTNRVQVPSFRFAESQNAASFATENDTKNNAEHQAISLFLKIVCAKFSTKNALNTWMQNASM